MNKLTIIGNLTRDPELQTTSTGIQRCTFTVAVNRRKKNPDEDPGADFFRVTAWRERGEICAKYLAKGRKVCVIGPVGLNVFTGDDGQTRANLEVTADEVEFLSSRNDNPAPAAAPAAAAPAENRTPQGFTQVSMEDDELPF